jgi:acetylornithine deacetylase
MDVVPVAGQNWDFDPFLLTENKEKLIGRGTTDMKSFIAATCHALMNMQFKEIKKPLYLLWTYDEEIGCVGSAQAAPLLKNYMTYLPKAALIGEPTDFTIMRMHAGHVTVKISITGVAAHSSAPDLGISAIKALHQVLIGIFALEKELTLERSLEEFFPRPFVLMNVGEIHGGTAVNIIPEEAYLRLGFRPLPDTSIDGIVERIKDACKLNEKGQGAHIAVSVEKISPPMLTQAGSKLEKVLLPLAQKSSSCAAQYSTDGGNLSQGGIECLIFGPGSVDVAHTANEWILKADVMHSAEKTTRAITEWFS